MRLIDADALPRHGDRGGLVHWKDIKEAPTIDIVRCKECAYVCKLLDPSENTEHLICHHYYHFVYEDDYCSYGVKE